MIPFLEASLSALDSGGSQLQIALDYSFCQFFKSFHVARGPLGSL